MQKCDQLLINKSATVMQALSQLEQTGERFLICVEDDGKLAGVVTDGDIRQGILCYKHLDFSLADVMNADPVSVSCQATPAEVKKLITNNILAIPVIDENKRVVGYYNNRFFFRDDSIKKQTIVIVGMGYVGLTLGIGLANIGFKVKGYDTNLDLVASLNRKELPFYEEGMQQSLETAIDNGLQVYSCLDAAKGDIYIITVGTPLNPANKQPNIGHITSAIESVGKALSPGNTVILRSTVPVGCARKIVIPLLEEQSGLKCEKDFFVAVATERTIEGRAIYELSRNPQIIGGVDDMSTDIAFRLFIKMTPSVIDVGSLEAAELAKLIDNSYRDHIFAYANMLAPLAEKLNLDLCNLIDAVNFSYKRNTIPKPSPGVGGPCLSKDPYILKYVFEQNGLKAPVITETRTVNEFGSAHIKNKLETLLEKIGKKIENAKITILGLAFKGHPETSDLRGSMSFELINLLPNLNHISAYDPVVESKVIDKMGVRSISLAEAFKQSDAIIIMNNHKYWKKINISELLRLAGKPIIFIDTWHTYDALTIKKIPGVVYGGLGND